MSKELLKEQLASAIFDTLSLYIVEQKFNDKMKELSPDKLKPIQLECEKLLKELGIED